MQAQKDKPPKGETASFSLLSKIFIRDVCSLKGRIRAARQGNDFDLLLATPDSGSAWDRIAGLRRTAKLAGGRRKT